MSDEKKHQDSQEQNKTSEDVKSQGREERSDFSLEDDGPSLVERYASGRTEQEDGGEPETGDASRGSVKDTSIADKREGKTGRVPPTIENEGFGEEAGDDFGADEAYDFSEGADDFGDDLGVDLNDDLDDLEAVPAKKKRASGRNRLVAPLAVLILAGGAGGYIVMNPDLVGGGATQVTSTMPPPSVSTAVKSVQNGASQPSGQIDVGRDTPSAGEGLDRPFGSPEKDSGDTEIAALSSDEPEFPVDMDGEIPREPAIDSAGEGDASQEGVNGNLSDEGNADNAFIPDIEADEDLEISGDAFAEPSLVAEAEDDAVPLPDESLLEDKPDTATQASGAEEASVVEADDEEDGAIFDLVDVEPASQDVEDTAGDSEPVVALSSDASGQAGERDYNEAVSDSSNARPQSKPVRVAQSSSSKSRYFDASSQVPSGSMATEIGPRKVDPVLEPAQKYMIVTDSKSEKDPEALLATANRALKLQRYDAAIEMFEQLYAKNNRDPRILMGLAVSLQKAGRVDASLSIYDELIEVAPDDKSAVVNMLGLLRNQYPSVAIRRLVDLQRQYPNDAMIAAQLGVTLADMGESDDAEKYIGMAISLEPRNAQHYMNMAVIADRQGKRNSAISYYEEALQVDAVYGNGRSIDREVIYDRLSVLRR